MSQGTRCHQLAMFVVFESPLQMLADSPSNYMNAPYVMNFLSKVPTTWDDTKVIKAKVSEYIVIARKKDNEWYLGAMTNWTPRKFEVDLSFLPKGNYTVDIYEDGINADRNAEDLKNFQKNVKNTDKITIKMAPGGGFAARIYKK
jgi:alpha-glucosidase